ncbi:MAG TPA: hypothetical protein VGP08_02280 [Pyrinomonadaceae bacterium]|jgi:hypothetical protein|nr:hypothetical protein [Pyrinomonadaceae bacterium]
MGRSNPDADARDDLIPPGEPETVQQLVAREVENVLALHTAKIDLDYRVRRHKELSARYRALCAEAAEVKRQMETLNLPPLLLRHLKSGLDDGS